MCRLGQFVNCEIYVLRIRIIFIQFFYCISGNQIKSKVITPPLNFVRYAIPFNLGHVKSFYILNA